MLSVIYAWYVINIAYMYTSLYTRYIEIIIKYSDYKRIIIYANFINLYGFE